MRLNEANPRNTEESLNYNSMLLNNIEHVNMQHKTTEYYKRTELNYCLIQ